MQSLLERCRFRLNIRVRQLMSYHLRQPARRGNHPLKVHIGHAFWGAGNAGDDFMLLGFLREIGRQRRRVGFTCCVPENWELLAKRYPEITWLPYTIDARWNAIRSADCWLGLGGTPFQTDSGRFFECQLDQEWFMCQVLAKPMDFLGIGVENSFVMQRPQFRRAFMSVRHCWARDERSAKWLDEAHPGRTTSAADLANILFRERFAGQERNPDPHAIGFLFNFEKPTENVIDTLPVLMQGLPAERAFWLVQDPRLLPGMENDWWRRFSESLRQRLTIFNLDWESTCSTSPVDFLKWPAKVISSRYHGALLAVWIGAKVLIVARSGKLTGLADQFGLPRVNSVSEVSEIISGVSAAATISLDRLESLAEIAAASVRDWLTEASVSAGKEIE